MQYIINSYDLSKKIDTVEQLVKNNLNVDDQHIKLLSWKNYKPSKCSLIKPDHDNSSYVGCVCLYARDFYIDSEEKRGCVFGDLVVDKEHRSVLPALKLLKHHTELALNEYDFIYTLPNSKSNSLFRRLDYINIGSMPRYAYLASYRLYVKGNTFLRKTAIFFLYFVDLTRKIYYATKKYYLNHKYLVINDNNINELKKYFGANTYIYTFSLKKDFDYIAWRHFFKPASCSRYLFINNNPELALIVYEINDNVIHIKDALFTSLIVMKDVMNYLISIAVKNNVKSVSIKYFGDDKFVYLLEKIGFVIRGDEKDIYFKSKSNEFNMLCQNKSNWSLFEGDEDI